MKINEMTNLWIAYNRVNNFRVAVVAEDEEDALEIVRQYAEDMGIGSDFEISEMYDCECKFDCDRIISRNDFE